MPADPACSTGIASEEKKYQQQGARTFNHHAVWDWGGPQFWKLVSSLVGLHSRSVWNCIRNYFSCAKTMFTFSTSSLLKVLRFCCGLYILTWTCASHHNGVHFFNISSSQSGPKLNCFAHFDFEMCFAPERRAISNLSSGHMAPHTPL